MQEHYSTVLQTGDERSVLFAVDAEGMFTLSEGAGLEALGLEPGELVGRSALDVYRNDPAVVRNLRRALAGEAFASTVEVGGVAFRCRYRPLRNGKDAVVVGAMGIAVLLNEHDGRTGAPVASAERIGRAEGARYPEPSLRGGEGQFVELVENSPDLVIVTQPDRRIRYVNPAVELLLGYRQEEFVGLAEDLGVLIEKIIHPEDRALAAEELKGAAGEPGWRGLVAVRARHKNGYWRHFEGYVNNLSDAPGVEGLVFVSRDVTERVRAEQEIGHLNGRLGEMVEERTARLREMIDELEEKGRMLAESEQRYRELVENVREGIGLIGIEGAIVEYCNGAYAEILGLSPKEIVGRSFLDFVDEGQREETLRQGELRLRGVGASYEVTVTVSDGKKKVLSCGGYPVFRNDGSYRESVQTIVDVTERKRMEQALLASEERFRITFERAAVGMAHVSLNGRWLRVNDKLSEIVGYSRQELSGLTFQDITYPDDLALDLRHVERMLSGEISEYSIEKRYIRKDRARVWIELTVSLVRDPEGETGYFITVVEDITERKLREFVPDPLTLREKAVLTQMATGLNNPQIAKNLAYSLGTVKLCVRCILSKLGVEDRGAAVTRAAELGIIVPLQGRTRS